MAANGNSAANRYAARVDAALAQRTRLRGPQPREISVLLAPPTILL